MGALNGVQLGHELVDALGKFMGHGGRRRARLERRDLGADL